MTFLLFFSLATTVLSGMGLLRSVLFAPMSRAASQRLLAVSRGPHQQMESLRIFGRLQHQLSSIVERIRSHFGISESPALIENFTKAGFTHSSSHDFYMALRVIGPIVAMCIGLFISSHRMVWMTALAGVMYLAPDAVLRRLIKRRQEKVRRSIPDAIDLLVICVDAGLGIDQALLRVGLELRTSNPEIYEEFQQINYEQRAGKLRLAAWKSMAERNNLPDLDSLVNMLMQTERFGTPIARALSSFADGIRQNRRQRAEELAAKTTVKIIFPLVLFIFPSMFVVLIGPAAIHIVRGLAGGQ